MKIPIWLTVKNIYKTIFNNLLSFVSLPTIVLLSLPYINSYLKSQIESFPILFITYIIFFIPFWIMICISIPLIISTIQKYLLTGDNQLSFNKIIPTLDNKQHHYILFYFYVFFYIYLLPQLVPIILGSVIETGVILMFADSLTINSMVYITYTIVAIMIIIFIFSLIKGLNASLVHCHVSNTNTNIEFKKLIEISEVTLINNKWRIFFITIISVSVSGIFIGLSKMEWQIIFNLQQYNTLYYIINVFIKYIIILTYASVNAHIYLFFKEQFEANLAKLTDEAAIVTTGDNKLL